MLPSREGHLPCRSRRPMIEVDATHLTSADSIHLRRSTMETGYRAPWARFAPCWNHSPFATSRSTIAYIIFEATSHVKKGNASSANDHLRSTSVHWTRGWRIVARTSRPRGVHRQRTDRWFNLNGELPTAMKNSPISASVRWQGHEKRTIPIPNRFARCRTTLETVATCAVPCRRRQSIVVI